MAPTMEVESVTLSSSVASVRGNSAERGSVSELVGTTASIGDLAGLSEICFNCNTKSVIPEASSVFKEALDNMKSEKAQDNCKKENVEKNDKTTSPTPATINSPSFLTKLKSAFKSTSSVSPHPSASRSEALPSKTSAPHPTASRSEGLPSKTSAPHPTASRSEGLPSKASATVKPVRRPASFGGSDGIKLSAGRRASQFEKRVSWADEYGSNHPLFSVRLIRPRLSADKNHVGQSTPGHSILRNTGIC